MRSTTAAKNTERWQEYGTQILRLSSIIHRMFGPKITLYREECVCACVCVCTAVNASICSVCSMMQSYYD